MLQLRCEKLNITLAQIIVGLREVIHIDSPGRGGGVCWFVV